MFSAVALEVSRMSWPSWKGHRVIDVAEHRRAVAAGRPTRHVPHADELVECRRWPVLRLWFLAGVAHQLDLGAACDEFGQ
jgi:hypothetical protein